MSKAEVDQAAAIAQFWSETPKRDLAGGAPLTPANITAEILRRFPTATFDEFRRAGAIAVELLETDAQEVRHKDMVNNPCPCGEPGIVVLIGSDGRPSGDRRCFRCSTAEVTAAKHPCVRCGTSLPGEDVEAGINLCVPCDPNESGWIDP